jgi:hypothetical protein
MSFGLTFADEIIMAGLGGLPLVWQINGNIVEGRELLTQEQGDILDAVIAKHNPLRLQAPEVLPPRMFYNGLSTQGHITEAEALAALEGTVPAALVDAAITLAPEVQYQVNMILTGGINLGRFPPLSDVVKLAFSLDDDGVYDLFAVSWSLG